MDAEAPESSHKTSDGLQRQDTIMRPTFIVNGQEGEQERAAPKPPLPRHSDNLQAHADNSQVQQAAAAQQHKATGDRPTVVQESYNTSATASVPDTASETELATTKDHLASNPNVPYLPPQAPSHSVSFAHNEAPSQIHVNTPANQPSQEDQPPPQATAVPAKADHNEGDITPNSAKFPMTQASPKSQDNPAQQSALDPHPGVSSVPENTARSGVNRGISTQQQEMDRLIWLYVCANQFPTWK